MRRLTKQLTRLALLVIATMLPQMASAHDFEVGGIYYLRNGNNATVTYRGSYSSQYSNEYTGAVNIPSTVTYNGTTYSVTSIDEETFSGCSGLTSVTIGNSVTWIGEVAFLNCTGLTSVIIGNSVTWIGRDAFYNCTGLTSVNITDLAAWCNIDFDIDNDYDYDNAANPLYYAHNLYLNGSKVTNLVIPSSVTTIKQFAFEDCTGLTSVTIPNSVTSIGKSAFWYCRGLTSVTIPNSVTSIGSYAFASCSGLTSMVVESGNTKYDSRNNCNAIIETATNTLISGCMNTIIPNSVTSIGSNAFYYCSGLTSVTIPNSVTSIPDYCFYNCSGLTSVTIPNSVTTIGDEAFSGCSGLTSVTIPNSVTSIGWYAFANCSGLTSVTIPNSVTTIPYECFYECTGLTSVTIPNSVTSIWWYAFANCSGLTSVTIPNSVTSIGYMAFSGCTGLTSVTIPNSVTSIGNAAFRGCTGLTSVYSKIKSPNNVSYGSDVFYYVSTSQCALYVPKCKQSIYRATSPWSGFSNIIEMDPTGDVNDDGKVNVTDYVATAGYILEMDPQPFYLEECDFNENGIISVGDLVGVATRVLSFEGAPMLAPAVGVTEEPSFAMAADVNGRDGSYEVAINLSNNIDLTALQMDLDLPAGMTLASVSLSDRASASHQVAFNQLSNGDYRLLASSPACKSFAGNDGAVLTLTLAGEPCGDGIIRNVELATPRGASYIVDDIELHFVGITGVENMTAATATRIYSDGSNIVIDSPASGTALIVLPNGISKTVTVTAGKNIFPAPASGMIIVNMGDSVKKLQIK